MADEVDVLLRLPVAEVRATAIVQPGDVQRVVESLSDILEKCLHCIRFCLSEQLDIFLFLLAQASVMQPDRVQRGMSQRTEDGTCFDLYSEMMSQLLSSENATLRLGIDAEHLVEVLNAVSGDVKRKDKYGSVLCKLLLDYMHDTQQHADDYRVHRGCASAVITLLRGSTANKNRLSAECIRISECLEQSSDFFFQMQCTEILFRLYSHNRAVLGQSQVRDNLRRGIESLPNDATLLQSMQNFLDGYNAEYNSDGMAAFTTVRVEVSGIEVCSHTTLYFSPLLLNVLLPGGTGDHITIPFEDMRSVKLSKDHKLGLRLNVIPARLASLMSLEEGKDTLHVFLTQSTLARLRSSCIHQWIAARKRSAPRRRPPPSAMKAAPQPTDRAEAANEEGGGVDGQLPRVALENATDSRRGSQQQSSRPPSLRSRNGNFPISEREANQPIRASHDKNNSRSSIEQKNEESMHEATDQRLAEVHRAAAVKAARHREQYLEHLQHASDGVQSALEGVKRLNARERDSFEANFREDMTAIRQSEASLKQGAAECVQSLNAELEDVQALGALLKSKADKLRERVAKTLGKSEGVEEACLLRIKNLVDTQVQMMEASLTRTLTTDNPLTNISEHLSQRISELSATVDAGRPKVRRLEYS